MSQYAFLLLLVLVCPLAMWLMMRGGHGHQRGLGARPDAARDEAAALEELRRRVDELDRRIGLTEEASDDRAAARA